jgi:hypothetical protein
MHSSRMRHASSAFSPSECHPLRQHPLVKVDLVRADLVDGDRLLVEEPVDRSPARGHAGDVKPFALEAEEAVGLRDRREPEPIEHASDAGCIALAHLVDCEHELDGDLLLTRQVGE